MGKPDNVRRLGSDYGLIMIKSTSLWTKINKERTEIIRESRAGALTTGALNGWQ